MKKIIFLIFLSFIWMPNIEASDKIDVTLSKCIDGDTAYFLLDGKQLKTRFLAIDTPESTNKIEPFGKEASNYTCTQLQNAKQIQIQYDENSDKLDKYNRALVWVFVDDELLQTKIIEQGLGKVAYLYGDYEYTFILEKKQLLARTNKVGIWQEDNINYIMIGIILLIVVSACILSTKYCNKVKRKLTKETKKFIKKIVP